MFADAVVMVKVMIMVGAEASTEVEADVET